MSNIGSSYSDSSIHRSFSMSDLKKEENKKTNIAGINAINSDTSPAVPVNLDDAQKVIDQKDGLRLKNEEQVTFTGNAGIISSNPKQKKIVINNNPTPNEVTVSTNDPSNIQNSEGIQQNNGDDKKTNEEETSGIDVIQTLKEMDTINRCHQKWFFQHDKISSGMTDMFNSMNKINKSKNKELGVKDRIKNLLPNSESSKEIKTSKKWGLLGDSNKFKFKHSEFRVVDGQIVGSRSGGMSCRGEARELILMLKENFGSEEFENGQPKYFFDENTGEVTIFNEDGTIDETYIFPVPGNFKVQMVRGKNKNMAPDPEAAKDEKSGTYKFIAACEKISRDDSNLYSAPIGEISEALQKSKNNSSSGADSKDNQYLLSGQIISSLLERMNESRLSKIRNEVINETTGINKKKLEIFKKNLELRGGVTHPDTLLNIFDHECRKLSDEEKELPLNNIIENTISSYASLTGKNFSKKTEEKEGINAENRKKEFINKFLTNLYNSSTNQTTQTAGEIEGVYTASNISFSKEEEQEFDGLKEKIQQTENKIDALKGEIEIKKEEIQQAPNEIDAIKGRIKATQGVIDSITKESQQNSKQGLKELNEQLKNLRKQLEVQQGILQLPKNLELQKQLLELYKQKQRRLPISQIKTLENQIKPPEQPGQPNSETPEQPNPETNAQTNGDGTGTGTGTGTNAQPAEQSNPGTNGQPKPPEEQ